jgi:hypothetical protein
LKVTVLTAPGTDLGRYFDRYRVVPGSEFDRVVGLTSAENLVKIATASGVLAVLNMAERQAPDAAHLPDASPDAPQRILDLVSATPSAMPRERVPPPALEPAGRSPEAFFTHDTNGVHPTWALGITGDGDVTTDPLKLAVVDTGVDFANPDLYGTQARVTDPASPYFAPGLGGWPIAFDDRSMSDYALDLQDDRGNWGWYMNAFLEITDPDPATTTPFTFSVTHPDSGATVVYTIGSLIQSTNNNGGTYSFGWHPDDSLADALGETPGVLVTGEAGAAWGAFDTVYVDMLADYVFDGSAADGWATLGQEVACVNLGLSGHGRCDLSGGMIYYIANGSTPVPASDWLYGLPAVATPGEVVAFMLNDFTEAGGDHGTLSAGAAVGQGIITRMPYTGTYGSPYWPPTWYNPAPWPAGDGGISQGPGRDTGLVAMGNYYAGGSALNYYDFATLGYDGVPSGVLTDTHDQSHIYINSYGSGAVEEDGWDLLSRYVTLINHGTLAQSGTSLPADGDLTPLFVGATGDGGFGYGTVHSPQPETGVMVGASTVLGQYDLGDPALFRDWVNWGHLAGFANRGPTAMSSPGVHVLANGFFGSGNLPLNQQTGGDQAVDYWAGTGRSSAEVGGLLALIYDAYFEETGAYPTWQTARALLMNGARTTFNDPLAQGAGLANAYNAVEIIRGSRGVLLTNSEADGYWVTGSYRGTEYDGFARGLFSGEDDTERFTVNNLNAADPVTVTLDAVTLALTDHREWNFTSLNLATEGGAGSYGRRLFGPAGSNPGYGAADPFYVSGVDDAVLADADLMVVRLSYPYEQFLDDVTGNRWALNATAWRDVDVVDGTWFTDTNGNGYLNDGERQDETVRISYDGHGNSTEIRIREPWDLIQGSAGPNEPPLAPMDDIVIMLRHLTYGGIDTTDLAVTVELYQEVSWDGLALSTASLTVPAAGSQVFDVTAYTVIPLSTVLYEDFEGTFPPAGWQVITNTTGGQWDRNDALGQPNSVANYGSGFSAAAGTNGGSGTAWDTELWSPAIDMSGLSAPILLQYASNFQDYAGNGNAYLDVSTDGGANWSNLYAQTDDDTGGSGGGGVLREQDLSAYIGQTIHLRWRFVASSAIDWFWQIDNVNIIEATVEPPGEYGGYVKLSYTEPYTYSQYVPVQQQIWFPSEIDPTLGGVDQPGLYDNGVMFGASGPSSSGQRAKSGDWRFFYTDVTNPPPAGTYMLAHTTWAGEGDGPNDTDIDTLFFAPEPIDPLFSGYGSLFGPSGLAVAGGSLRTGSGPNWDYHTTTGGPGDWSSIPLTSEGLHGVAAQVVRWGGERTKVPFTITVGTAQATPEVVLSGLTCLSCTVPLSFKTNHEDLTGLPLEAAGYGFTRPASETLAVTQGASTYYTYTISATDAYYLEITTAHPAANVDNVDADLVVSYWDGGAWVPAGDSTRADSNERIRLTYPPAGDYRVEIQGTAIPGGTTGVQLNIKEVSGLGAMVVSGLPISVELGVEYTPDLHFERRPDPGIWNGAVFLGPAGSPVAIEIPVTLYQGGAEKVAWQDTVLPGQLVTFTLDLTENPGDVTGWSLEDTIPAGFEFVAVDGATYDGGANAIYWHNAAQRWLDATTTLALTSGTSDDGYGALSMPFDFTFFTHTLSATNELRVSTNGYATFGTDGTDFSNDAIPNATDPDDYVGPFWDDQKIDGGDTTQGMWYGVHGAPGDQILALQWRVQDLGSTTQPNEFQAQLHESGEIWFLYRDMNQDRDGWGNSATIGLEDTNGLAGTQYSYNSVSIADDWAIHFTPNVSGTYDVAYAGPLYEPVGSHVVTLTLRALTPGHWTNTAYVDTGPNSCPISNTVLVAEAVPTWEKEIRINDAGPWLPLDGPFTVVPGDAVTIVDRVTVTSTGPITYSLSEAWTPSLDLVEYATDWGTVYTTPGSLAWSVAGGVPGAGYTLTKTLQVNGENGFYDTLTETLTVVGGGPPEVMPVEFVIPALVAKDGPATAYRGDVVSYSLVVEQPAAIPLDGSLMLTDVLTAGIAYAGNLSAPLGSAWYVPADNAVYWNNAMGRATTAAGDGLAASPAVTLTFDVTVTALPGVAVTNVARLEADGRLQPAAHTFTVLASDEYGVTLAPETAARSGAPGTTVTYTLMLTNTGSLTGTFDLLASGNTWTASHPATVGPLAASGMAYVTVTVNIPGGATNGDADGVAITARSQSDPLAADSSTLTTTAVDYAIYLPVVWKASAAR